LVFEKNAIFSAENWQKSHKIVIITSTPGGQCYHFKKQFRQKIGKNNGDFASKQFRQKIGKNIGDFASKQFRQKIGKNIGDFAKKSARTLAILAQNTASLVP
jgi:hypothetical protein